MTTGWEISERLKKRGKNVKFIGTGQTGIMLASNGAPIDAVVADFMAGELEHALDLVNDQTDLIIVEGQGALTNQYYAGVTLGLMYGTMPDYMIMTDEPGRTLDVSNNKMVSIGDVMGLHLSLMKHFRPSQFLGINLLTYKMDEELALKEIKKLSKKYNLKVVNAFHAGDGNLHPIIVFDGGNKDQFKRTEELGAEILKLCVKLGGVLTGEHGVGIEKRELMCEMFNDNDIQQQLSIKKTLDQKNLLNPGKVYPILRKCAEEGRVHVHRGKEKFPDLPRF